MRQISLISIILILSVFMAGCSTEKPDWSLEQKNIGDGNIITSSGQNSKAFEGEPESDKKMVRRAVEEIFSAYNSEDNVRITSTLKRYINPDQCKKMFKEVSTNLDFISINGTYIYKDVIDHRKNKFVLGDNDIRFFKDEAVMTGFADGNALVSGSEIEKGPWRITCAMYKSSGSWFVEYIKFKKVERIKLEYYPQTPKDYEKNPDKKWPLIVFLHGSGERGGTIEDVKKMNHSIPMMASRGKDFPFIAVSPLCPDDFAWKDLSFSVIDMIDEVTSKYNIDIDRIYLTGLSLGGIGTWSIALQFPDKFAAIAPVCGDVDPDKAEKLKKLPIWAFHGAKDTVVPMEDEQRAVERLKACGGNIRYTIYPDVAHEAWNKAYTNAELYEWFLQHQRNQ